MPKTRNMSCTVHRRALPDGPHGLGACPGCKLRIVALSIDVPATIIAFDTRNTIDGGVLSKRAGPDFRQDR